MRVGILILLFIAVCTVAVYSFRSDIPYLNDLFQTRVETKKPDKQKTENKIGSVCQEEKTIKSG